MTFHSWLAFAALFLVLSYTPGPNMLLAASHGMMFGPKRTLATAAGLVFGLWIWIAVSTAGLGAVLAASERGFALVRWAGAAYMVWLGFKALRADAPDLTTDDNDDAQGTAFQRFTQGCGVSLSNPKAIVVFTAVLPQFLDPSRPMALQIAHEVATITVLEFSMIMSTSSVAGRLVPWLRRSGRGQWINRVSGAVLLLAAGLLAASALIESRA